MFRAVRLLSPPLTFSIPQGITYAGESAPSLALSPTPLPSTVTLSAETARAMYTDMLVIRTLENFTMEAFRKGHVRGFCHSSSGQEAIAVGTKASLTTTDNIITGYRVHGWQYMATRDTKAILGEAMGKQCGVCKGKGGSMHMYCPERGIFGGHGIVGAQVPIGVGIALAEKLKKTNNVTIALYGDGASNQGQVYEAYNLAALWNVPVIFAIENNHFAMGTAVSRGSFHTEFYKRAGYLPGLKVDGMNVLACREAIAFAKEFVLSKQTPMLVEFDTSRFDGHSASDGQKYLTEEMKAEMKKRDPLTIFSKLLIDGGVCTEEEIESATKSTTREIGKCYKQLIGERETDLSELTTDIFAGPQFPVRSCQSGVYL